MNEKKTKEELERLPVQSKRLNIREDKIREERQPKISWNLQE
jgi:hypothetical protein